MRRHRVNVCGGTAEIAVPIGFLEDVARLEPAPFTLYERICGGVDDRGRARISWATLRDVREVLRSALAHGGARVTAEQVIEYEGLHRAWSLAAEALELAMRPPEDLAPEDLPGKPPAGATDGAAASSA